ncbi:MAG TPA: SHOCT domain-containing protein [Candidatus Binatia bacterium]|nr:SHOCT domain-containing protein [Candidatus Binatia bacterium]
MKKTFSLLVPGLLAMTLLSGCLDLQLGGGSKVESSKPTVGQQLVDLQKARDNGAITDAEYQAEKNRLLQLNQK